MLLGWKGIFTKPSFVEIGCCRRRQRRQTSSRTHPRFLVCEEFPRGKILIRRHLSAIETSWERNQSRRERVMILDIIKTCALPLSSDKNQVVEFLVKDLYTNIPRSQHFLFHSPHQAVPHRSIDFSDDLLEDILDTICQLVDHDLKQFLEFCVLPGLLPINEHHDLI